MTIFFHYPFFCVPAASSLNNTKYTLDIEDSVIINMLSKKNILYLVTTEDIYTLDISNDDMGSVYF